MTNRTQTSLFAAALLVVGSTMVKADEGTLASACEESIKSFLHAPSTFNEIDSRQASDDPRSVILEFDAQNRVGVPLRVILKCSPEKSGLPPAKFQVRIDDMAFIQWRQTVRNREPFK